MATHKDTRTTKVTSYNVDNLHLWCHKMVHANIKAKVINDLPTYNNNKDNYILIVQIILVLFRRKGGKNYQIYYPLIKLILQGLRVT